MSNKGEVVLLLALQVGPRRLDQPIFGKPVFTVAACRVENEGENLGFLLVQSHTNLEQQEQNSYKHASKLFSVYYEHATRRKHPKGRRIPEDLPIQCPLRGGSARKG